MALSDKNIIITPNISSSTADPNIRFSSGDASSSGTITLRVLSSGTVGTLSFEGSAGQLFSLSDTFVGTIFSVNDASGIPSIEVLDTGEIKLAEYNGFVNIKGTTNATSTNTGELIVAGGVGIGRDLYVGGTIYGSVTGVVSGSVSTASSVNTVLRTTNASHFVTFVDSNNASITAESLYTTSSLVVNPGTGNAGVGGAPTARFHIQGSTADQIVLDADHTNFSGRNARFPGRVVIGPAGSGYPAIAYNATPTSAGAWNYVAGDTVYRIDLGNSNRITFSGAATGTAGAAVSWTDLMYITLAGNVGIGAAPSARLQSTGAAQTTTPTGGSATGAGLYITNTDSAYGTMFGVASTGRGWIQQQRSDSSNTQYDLAINPIGGNVSIGAGTPQAKFDVAGAVVSNLQTILARFNGDNNFWLSAFNGNTATNASGSEVARFGISYSGSNSTNFSSGFTFRRGAGAPDGSLGIITNATERITIDSAGDTGINTTPSAKLHVNGGTAMTAGWNRSVLLQATYPVIVFNSNSTKWGGIGYDHSSNLNIWVNGSSNDLTAAGTAALSLNATTGAAVFNSTLRTTSLGVGVAPTGTTGEIIATNEITAYYSDRRLKENVIVIEDAIAKVKKLTGITYTPNKLAENFGYDVNKKLVGLFADEVESVLPEAVRPAPFDTDENGNSKSGENYKTIQYEKVVPLLVEAIKEQQKIIDQILSELKIMANK